MNEEPESWTLKGFLAGFVLVAVVLFCFVLIMIAVRMPEAAGWLLAL